MTPDEVPQTLIDIIDRHAGRKHSRTGSVVKALAEVLTEYERYAAELTASQARHKAPQTDAQGKG